MNANKSTNHVRKSIHVAAAVIHENNRIFATARGYGEFKEQWEFPGGKLEPGESAEQAVVREIREELATEIRVEKKIETLEYDYPEFHLIMDCFLCKRISGNLELLEAKESRWLDLKALDSVQWLPADRKVLNAIRQLISGSNIDN